MQIKNKIFTLFIFGFLQRAYGMQQPSVPTNYPLANLQGLPREMKQHVLSFIVSGNFKISLTSITYLYGTCRSWNTFIMNPDCMLAVLKTVPYTANAIQLSKYLNVKDDPKVIAWVENAEKCLEKGKELLDATTNGDDDAVNKLLRNKNIALYEIQRKQSQADHIPLTLAVSKGNTKIVQLILITDLDIDYYGTLFYVADNKEIMAKLINAGASINTCESCHVTPLAWAVIKEHKNTISCLREAGATLNRHDNKGGTPLIGAVEMACPSLDHIKAYKKAGADINFPDKNGKTALMEAVSTFTKEKIAEELLYLGADPNLKDKAGRTAAMHAANAGMILDSQLEILWRFNADFSLRDNSGLSAYDISLEEKNKWAETRTKTIADYIEKQIKRKNEKEKEKARWWLK